MNAAKTVFLRLEGPLQSWGTTSRQGTIHDTGNWPTKSGVLGMVCAAMGLTRPAASDYLPTLSALRFGVRFDRPGTVLSDYHTAGAGYGLMTAGGKIKYTATTGEIELHISRRDYLEDASFLAALQGDPATVDRIAAAVADPVWPLFLGRKSCPPTCPVHVGTMNRPFDNLTCALESVPWIPRSRAERPPNPHRACVEVEPAAMKANSVRDVPRSFDPPVHGFRLVRVVDLNGVPVGERVSGPFRPRRDRVDYGGSKWKGERLDRLEKDRFTCVFCKAAARDVHHLRYAEADIDVDRDLRSLCKLCHDAVTWIEYSRGMHDERVDPCQARWRQVMYDARARIVAERNEDRRQRHFGDEEDD